MRFWGVAFKIQNAFVHFNSRSFHDSILSNTESLQQCAVFITVLLLQMHRFFYNTKYIHYHFTLQVQHTCFAVISYTSIYKCI